MPGPAALLLPGRFLCGGAFAPVLTIDSLLP